MRVIKKYKVYFSKYFSNFNRQSLAACSGTTFIISCWVLDPEVLETVKWISNGFIYPIILTILSSLLLPLIKDFFENKEEKNKERLERLGKWAELVFSLLAIFYLHSMLFYCSFVWLISYLNSFEILSRYSIFLLYSSFSSSLFIWSLSFYSAAKLRYQIFVSTITQYDLSFLN